MLLQKLDGSSIIDLFESDNDGFSVFWVWLIILLKVTQGYKAYGINVTGGGFKSNGTTYVPKSIPHLVVVKVKLLFLSEMLYSLLLKHEILNKLVT